MDDDQEEDHISPLRKSSPQEKPLPKSSLRDDTVHKSSRNRKRVRFADTVIPSNEKRDKKRRCVEKDVVEVTKTMRDADGEDEIQKDFSRCRPGSSSRSAGPSSMQVRRGSSGNLGSSSGRNGSSPSSDGQSLESSRLHGLISHIFSDEPDSPKKAMRTADDLEKLGHAIKECGEKKVRKVMDKISKATVKGWEPEDAVKHIRGVVKAISEMKLLCKEKGKVYVEQVLSFITMEVRHSRKLTSAKKLSVVSHVDEKEAKRNPAIAKMLQERKRKETTLSNVLGKRIQAELVVSEAQALDLELRRDLREKTAKRNELIEQLQSTTKRTEEMYRKIKEGRAHFKELRAALVEGNRTRLSRGNERRSDSIADGQDQKVEDQEDEIRPVVAPANVREAVPEAEGNEEQKARRREKMERVWRLIVVEEAKGCALRNEALAVRMQTDDVVAEKEEVEEEVGKLNDVLDAEHEKQDDAARAARAARAVEEARQAEEAKKAAQEEAALTTRKKGGARKAKGKRKTRARK